MAAVEVGRVFVYGGKGALGSTCVSLFKSKRWVSFLLEEFFCDCVSKVNKKPYSYNLIHHKHQTTLKSKHFLTFEKTILSKLTRLQMNGKLC